MLNHSKIMQGSGTASQDYKMTRNNYHYQVRKCIQVDNFVKSLDNDMDRKDKETKRNQLI